MRDKNFILVCFLILVLSPILGCALLGGEHASGINWALEKNGGKVTAFSETPAHPISALNNGITSSENWDQGEGWQASIGGNAGRGRGGFGATQARGGNAGRGRGGVGGMEPPEGNARGGRRGTGGMRQERNWVTIELFQPVTVSHVMIHTVDSEQYPAKDYGVSHLLVQYEKEIGSEKTVWLSADRYGKGVGNRDNIIRDNVKGVINVRFEPVKTKRIRVIIYGTNDMTRSEGSRGRRGGRGGSRNMSGTIRLTEIEVYGT